MQVVLLALWPLFALIVSGFTLQRLRFFADGFWPGAERLNYFFLFPALLISSLAQTSFANPQLLRLALVIVLTLVLATAFLWWFKRRQGWDNLRFGVWIQGGLRFNTYLGLAAIGSLLGPEGLVLAALLLAIKVPLVNVISVWSFSVGQGVSLRKLVLPIVKNPLIQGCVIGVLLNISGVGLPFGFDRWLSMLGAASLPLGLLCVGAALQPASLLGERNGLLLNSLFKLILLPLLVLLLAYCFGLGGNESMLLMVFFALPTAASSYILTQQMGGDGQLMAGVITLQTALAALSLPILLWVASFLL